MLRGTTPTKATADSLADIPELADLARDNAGLPGFTDEGVPSWWNEGTTEAPPPMFLDPDEEPADPWMVPEE